MSHEIQKEEYQSQLSLVRESIRLIRSKIYNDKLKTYNRYRNGVKRRKDSWESSKTCMFPGCCKETIKHSHTIQRALLFDSISEDNHVLHPRLNEEPTKTTFKLERISLNKASTFPGYCIDHESKFEFEKLKEFITDEDFELQVFRVICRELAAKRNDLEWMEKVYDNLVSEYWEQLKTDFETRLNKKMNDELYSILKTDFSKEVLLTCSDFRLLDRYKEAVDIRQNFHDLIVDSLKKKEKNKIAIKQCRSKYIFPVSLAGIGGVELKNRFTKIKETGLIIFNILPTNKGTVIIFAAEDKFKFDFEEFFNQRTENELTILSMIESVMAYGTDEWYIRESVWAKIDEKKKKLLLNDIIECKSHFSHPYRFSIFDDIRQKLIKSAEIQHLLDPSNEILFHHIEEAKKRLEIDVSNLEVKSLDKIEDDNIEIYLRNEILSIPRFHSEHINYIYKD